MKNIIKLKSQLLIIALLMGFAISVSAYEKEGVIEKEFDIKSNTRINFSNKSSDLTVKVWNQQKVKLECFYKLRASDQEDLDLTIQALEEMEVHNSPSLLEIKTGIFTTVRSTVITGLVNKIVATLTTGPIVNLKEYKLNYILTVPDNHDFKLHQKYSEVNMPDYVGKIEFDLYDVDMRAGQTPNVEMLKTKYSNLFFESLGNCEMDIYDTDIEIGVMGDMNLKSKYSKIEADVVGTVVIDSYDDKLYFTELKSIVGKAKYTDLHIGNIEFGDLNLYDCELRAKDCGSKLKLTGKYSGIVFKNVDILEYPDCYDNKVEANYVGEFSSNSKYTEFEFERVAGMIDLDTYDDKLTVSRIDKDFYSIRVNGKYAKIDLTFLGTPQYFLDVDFKYTKYEFPDGILYSDVQTKSSQFIAKGRTEGLKSSDNANVRKGKNGVRKADIGKMSFVQYDGTLSIKY